MRSRLSRSSVDRQTSQSQPMTGTPWEVPVPRNVTFKSDELIGFDFLLFLAGQGIDLLVELGAGRIQLLRIDFYLG